MISHYIHPANIVIESKGKIGDIAIRHGIIAAPVGEEIVQVMNDFVSDNGSFIIKNEWDAKGVCISDQSHHHNQQPMGQRTVNKSSQTRSCIRAP